MSAPTIPLARPAIGPAELEAQARALASGRLVVGPENAAFEAGLARETGRAHAICVSSGTAALHLALWALDLPPGAEVVVAAFMFPAAANVARALGLGVVPVDLEPATWNVSVRTLSAVVGPRTRAVVAVDQLGLATELEEVAAWCEARKLPLIEDAACALGARTARGGKAGAFGAMATLSFHPRKIVTTGEGGAIVCDDDALAARLRRLRNHGQESPGKFTEVGINARLPEPAAAVGAAQLARLEEFLGERNALAARYVAGLPKHVRPQEVPAGARHAWQTFAVLLPEGAARAKIVDGLRARGIESGPATYAVHRIGTFPAPELARAGANLPVADALHDRSLALPLYAGLATADVDRVLAALREVLA